MIVVPVPLSPELIAFEYPVSFVQKSFVACSKTFEAM
jgi:hypothetical protein